VFAIKGASTPGKPILGKATPQDVNYKGKMIKGGVLLWAVGTDTAKSQIYGRLKLLSPGPGFMHFPIGLPDEYYMQLTAEKMVTRYNSAGYPVNQWIVTAKDKRNEALDCENYCMAAAHRAGISRISQKTWDDLEESFKNTSESAGANKKPTAQPAKSNWMSQ